MHDRVGVFLLELHQRAAVPYCNNFFHAKNQFVATKCAATVFDALNDAVEPLEVFPDESADSGVVVDSLFLTIGL